MKFIVETPEGIVEGEVTHPADIKLMQDIADKTSKVMEAVELIS